MSDGWEDLNGAELLWRQHKSHMSLYGEQYVWSFLVAKTIKNLPAMQETWVRSLGQKDPLGKGMATHSSILTWRIPWTEEPGGLHSMGSQSVRHSWATNTFTLFLFFAVVFFYYLVFKTLICSVTESCLFFSNSHASVCFVLTELGYTTKATLSKQGWQ